MKEVKKEQKGAGHVDEDSLKEEKAPVFSVILLHNFFYSFFFNVDVYINNQ